MGGKFIVDTATETYASSTIAVSNQSLQTPIHISIYITEHRIVVLVALLCALISILGLISILPWHYIWRSREEYMAARIANTGLKKKIIKALPCIVYSKVRSEPNVAECPVCLAEFMEGERLRVLPKCKHSFHMECVDKWLLSHLSCPTCRHCILDTEAHVLQCCSNLIQCSRSEATLVQVHVPRPLVEGDQCIDCGV